jgi:hypothetical protein
VRAILALGVLALPGMAWAQAEGNWLVDQKTRCKFWWPQPNDVSGSEWTYTYSSPRWSGACRNGTAQGRGTFEFVETRRYKQGDAWTYTTSGEGDFVAGKLAGKGFTTASQGKNVTRREGEFRDGLLNGKAVLTTESPTSFERYEGGFVDGKKSGWGVDVNESWRPPMTREHAWYWRYEGEYRNGDWNGKGVYTGGKKGCSSQEKYEGEYANGRWHGRGTMRTIDGKTYTGVWNEGTLNNNPKLSTIELHALADDIDKVCR